MAETAIPLRARKPLTGYQIAQIILGILLILFLLWRVPYSLFVAEPHFGPEIWLRFAISGLIIGSVYALIAIGYTLVYGILRMINFAHGDVMMIGAFTGFFIFEGLAAWTIEQASPTYPILRLVILILFTVIVLAITGWAVIRLRARGENPLISILIPLVIAGVVLAAGFWLRSSITPDPDANSFLNLYPIASIIFAFASGMVISMLTGITLERIAYRPLRGAPRLVPLISAIGASIFLEEAARLMFGSQSRTYQTLDALPRGKGFEIIVNTRPVIIPFTGVFTLVLSLTLLLALYLLVQRTRLGRAMRAVSEDKRTAALMGIDVDKIISRTFALSGALAGAAGVMWGIHNGQIDFFVGFIPGLKAFTSAVLGGVGNIPGAMLGAIILGVTESTGPAALRIDFQLKDVIGFSILVLMLIFRPSGLLGEALSEEKV